MRRRTAGRRAIGAVAALLLAGSLASLGLDAVSAGVAHAAVEQPFAVRFSANDTGAIAIAGNTLMTCPAAVASCGPAQQGAGSGAVLSNNAYAMGHVDVDGDPATFASSGAVVSLPAGASVLFAGLYYGGRVTAGAGGGAAAPDAAARGQVALRVPGAAGYAPVGAAAVYDSAAVTGAYVGFADVTAQVAAAGAGAYGVANVQSGTGQDRYAGWALVVAYRDPAQPPRNLTVFDGLAAVQQGDPPLSLDVSGFTTPLTGPVRSSVGLVAYEGDRGSAGDRLSLQGAFLSDAANPATNVFNSSIAVGGTDVSGLGLAGTAPGFVNQLGFDADTIAADGILANGATSATLQQSTTLDQYLTQVVTVATDLLPSLLPGPPEVPVPPVDPSPAAPPPAMPAPVAPVAPAAPGPAGAGAFAVDVAGAPAAPAAGQLADVVVELENTLDQAVENVRVVVGVPITELLSARVEGGRCVVRAVARCTIPSVGPGERVAIRLRVRARRARTLRAVVRISGDGIATQRLVARARGVAAPRTAVVRVSKAASVERARPGQVVRYRIVVRARPLARGGPGRTLPARRLRVCDVPARGLTILSAPGAALVRDGGSACWRLARLAVGAERVLRVVARVDRRRAGEVANTASAQAAGEPVRIARALVRVVPLPARACPGRGAADAAGVAPRARAAC